MALHIKNRQKEVLDVFDRVMVMEGRVWREVDKPRVMVYGKTSRGQAERYWDKKEDPSRLCWLEDRGTWAVRG